MYLAPLGLSRSDAWITDCLDTYRASDGVERAIESVYNPVALAFGLPRVSLGPHPDELDIVAEATRDHSGRLVAELSTCAPDILVTLGNAALSVLWSLPGVAPLRHAPPASLSPRDYGRPCDVRLGARKATLFALGHPNIVRRNDAYGAAHSEWMRSVPRP
jgi:hypothetical protein